MLYTCLNIYIYSSSNQHFKKNVDIDLETETSMYNFSDEIKSYYPILSLLKRDLINKIMSPNCYIKTSKDFGYFEIIFSV